MTLCDVDHHLIPRQVCGQRAVVTGRAVGAGLRLSLGLGFRLLLPGLVLGHGLLEVLDAELQLVRRELLRATAELVARQPLDQQPKLVVLGVQFALLMQQRAQHLLISGSICTPP